MLRVCITLAAVVPLAACGSRTESSERTARPQPVARVEK
jgi:hypothetical protein